LLGKYQLAKSPYAFPACSAQAYHQMVHAEVAALKPEKTLVVNFTSLRCNPHQAGRAMPPLKG
jgi:hypothetical protein